MPTSVATVDEIIEECSSAGGTHVLFKVGAELVHWGGHGVNLSTEGFARGDCYLVTYASLAAAESIENKKWCVPPRVIHGRVTAVAPLASDRSECDD